MKLFLKNAMFSFSAGLLCIGLCISSTTAAQVYQENSLQVN